MRAALWIWALVVAAIFCFEQQPRSQMLLLGAGKQAGASGSSTATWNPADTDSQTTLSNGNLTASTSAGSFAASGFRATVSATASKKYSEHLIVATGGFQSFLGLGISVAAFPLTGQLNAGGGAAKHIGWGGDGMVFTQSGGGAPVTTIQTFTAGDTLGMAIDFGANNIWFRTNGGNWNNSALADPSTNTGGISFASEAGSPLFPAMSQLVFTAVNQISTANFGGSAYAQTPPSGFGNW